MSSKKQREVRSPTNKHHGLERRDLKPQYDDEDEENEGNSHFNQNNSEEEDDVDRSVDTSYRNVSIHSQGSNFSTLRNSVDRSFQSPSSVKSNISSLSSKSPKSPTSHLYPSVNNSAVRRRGDSNSSSPLYPSLNKTPPSRKGEVSYLDLSRWDSDSSFFNSPKYQNESQNNSNIKRTHSKETQESSSSSNTILIIVLIMILISLVYFIYAYKDSSVESKNEMGSFEDFVSRINILEKSLPGQDKRVWKVFKASARHVLNEAEPSYPTIILMASETSHSRVANCIAKKAAIDFESSLRVRPTGQTTDINTFSFLESPHQKLKLDAAFETAFQSSSSKAIVVDNLQALSAEAALLLYKYCDGDNAPHKDVLIVLKINVPSHEKDNLSSPQSVESYLSTMWSREVHQDKIDALMTRIANNIVIVKDEKSALVDTC